MKPPKIKAPNSKLNYDVNVIFLEKKFTTEGGQRGGVRVTFFFLHFFNFENMHYVFQKSLE